MDRFFWQTAAASLLVCLFSVSPAHAQLNTQHIKGVTGLKSGSQPPPHWYATLPLIYTYDADTVRDRDGQELRFDADLTSVVYGVGLMKVTTKKIFGANYGFQVLLPVWANNRIQGTEIDANPGGGLTDGVIQPISLGWHFSRADAIAGYSLFVPTGRYEDGATDNTGLGMWGQELSFGTTVYLNDAKQYHLATLASLTFQSKKEDSETQVGTAVNFEGGAGADFLRGGLTVGLAYYASFKLAQDEIDGVPDALIRGRNKVFALGPEVSLALARRGVLYGFLKFNYQWEVYAQTNTQGSEFNMVLSLPIKPIKLP